MTSVRSLVGGRNGEPVTGLIDAVDRRLLAELAREPRLSKSALARRVGLSTPTVSNRVARLERLGVIRGYLLDVDPAALGWTCSAWVRIRPGPGQMSRITELAEQTPQVTECHRITGEDSFVMRIHATSMAALEQILDRFQIHGQTTTAVVPSSPIPPRPLPIDVDPLPPAALDGVADLSPLQSNGNGSRVPSPRRRIVE